MLDAVEGGEPDRDITHSVVIDHSTGIRVLLAPPSPEGADLVTPAYLRRMVDFLRESHDFVVVDLPSALNDHSLAIMDAADQIVVSPHSRSRPSRTFDSSWRWPTSWNTTGRRSDWW